MRASTFVACRRVAQVCLEVVPDGRMTTQQLLQSLIVVSGTGLPVLASCRSCVTQAMIVKALQPWKAKFAFATRVLQPATATRERPRGREGPLACF